MGGHSEGGWGAGKRGRGEEMEVAKRDDRGGRGCMLTSL